MYLVAILMSYQ
uniref:Uncharacterized protein n=1 Tax=Arundo donax TaxID=35708 RepID=A0A0A9AZ21_ARUDO